TSPSLNTAPRIWMFTNYYTISPGMVSKSPGAAAMYVIAFTDSEGTPLVGGSSYRLNLPANIPARLFWSVTLYEAENASGLANGQPFPSLGSKDKPGQNDDGSRAISPGPRPPKENKATGAPPCRAEDTSPSSGSTARPNPPSTRAGSQGTSRRW